MFKPKTPQERLDLWPSATIKTTRASTTETPTERAQADEQLKRTPRALPHMEIDPQTYAVRADGQLLTCEPAQVLPMAQRYFLF